MSGRPALRAGAILLALGGPAWAQGPVIENRIAVLQGLDKVTARISPVRAPIDVPTSFGTLEIVARTCRETPPTEPPESAAFLEIRELPPASDLNPVAPLAVDLTNLADDWREHADFRAQPASGKTPMKRMSNAT